MPAGPMRHRRVGWQLANGISATEEGVP
jgi:hypothetical protein